MSSRHPICDPAPDPVDVMRRLQEIARSHPALAADLDRANTLIGKQAAALIDVQRVLLASRLVERMT